MADPAVGTDPKGEPKTDVAFTQEQVNAIVGKRVLEERGKFADYETLKGQAQKLAELEKANLSKEEKLQRELAEYQRKATDAEGRIATTAIRSEVLVKASQMGIVDPDAAYRLIDRAGIAYSEDGVKGVDEALEALVAAKPYLRGVAPTAPNLNPKGGAPAPVVTGLTQEEREYARKLGVPEADYLKAKQ